MIKNSLRQLFRTRVKVILFFSLMLLSSLLVCLGINLLIQCNKNMQAFKDVFVTVGTVEQLPISISKQARYNAETESYTYSNHKEYGDIFSLSDLPSEGVTYISGPERRPYYSTYLPDYKIINDNEGWSNEAIIEMTPTEDCIPKGPVSVQVKRVLFSIYEFHQTELLICDHFNDNPQPLYKGKTYMMGVAYGFPHGWVADDPFRSPFEYVPTTAPFSEQTLADGTLIESKIDCPPIEEMNEEFYAKGHDKYWEAYATEMNRLYSKVPVTATSDMNLLMSYYNGDLNLAEGSYLDEDDFANGNLVCLITQQFARRNDIHIGDTITLPLRVADYGLPSVFTWDKCPLTAEGENFDVFFTGDYTVKGIYLLMPSAGTDKGYLPDANEIFIPKSSITVDDSNNIGSYGEYISPYNTSFRIPNGTIEEFMEAWEKKGIENVAIHFYDKGYSKLEDGIHQMEKMAFILMIGGAMMTVLVILFFCSLMITGQKKRTAIERGLGASKRECLKSLLGGILLVAAAGCLVGCLCGTLTTGVVTNAITKNEIFDRTYSSGVVNSNEIEEPANGGNGISAIATFIGILLFTTSVAFMTAKKNLKEEPFKLFQEGQNP